MISGQLVDALALIHPTTTTTGSRIGVRDDRCGGAGAYARFMDSLFYVRLDVVFISFPLCIVCRYHKGRAHRHGIKTLLFAVLGDCRSSV